MEFLIVVGSLAGGVILYILLGFTNLNNLRLFIIVITLLINLIGLLKVQTRYEPSVLGSSDFIVGRIGNCEKSLGAEKCYEKVEYRGFPSKAIRTTYKNKDGETTKHHTFSSVLLNAGSPKGGGFIFNIGLYGLVVSTILYFATRKSS